MRVEALDAHRFAGGLRPLGRDARSGSGPLRFRGANGLEYTFRPLDERPPLADEPAFRGTIAGRLVEDRISARHPAATLVAAALLRAAGVWEHAAPRLVVLSPGGEPGVLQEELPGWGASPREDPGGEDGAARPAPARALVVGTDELVHRLRADPRERVDARAYLAARVMELFLGVAPGEGERWRWTRSGEGGGAWRPVPLGRESAFAHQGGLLDRASTGFLPPSARIDGDMGRDLAPTPGDLPLDQQILAALPRSAWDAVAAELRDRLSDAAIEAALRQMPPEYHAEGARELGARLRERRDRLPRTVERLYALMSSDVEVHATEGADLALVRRSADGAVDVRLHAFTPSGEPEATPYFERTFLPGETREVRIHLHGGNDRALLRGTEPRGPRVRVVGGAGEDVLADSSTSGLVGRRTAFHDHSPGDLFLGRPGTFVDRRSPVDAGPASAERTWGAERSVRPTLSYHSSVGAVVGGTARYTRYGFRQRPFAYEVELRGAYATAARGFSAEMRGEFHRVSSDVSLLLEAGASQYELVRYYGFGNETEEDDTDPGVHDVLQERIVATGALRLPLASSAWVAVGPVLKYTAPRIVPGSPIDRERPLGSEPFGQVGAMLRAVVDRQDAPVAATRGVLVEATGAYYPAAWDLTEAFGRAGARVAAYLPTPVPGGSVLGVSVTGERVWGSYPLQEAAFMGGGDDLRGFHGYRFAGDAALYGRAGMRARLTTANLLVRGDLGVFVVADAGRVFYRDEPSDRWHADAGGGLWFLSRIEGREPYVASLTLVRGERMRFFLGMRMPF